jgi:hypothetical protein
MCIYKINYFSTFLFYKPLRSSFIFSNKDAASAGYWDVRDTIDSILQVRLL